VRVDDAGVYKPTWWHRYIDHLVSGMVSLEERALLHEEARRLELRTNLQEERIARRRAADKARADRYNKFNEVAVLRVKCVLDARRESATVVFHLSEAANGRRQIEAVGATYAADDGRVPPSVLQAARPLAWVLLQEMWLDHLASWFAGQASIRDAVHNINKAGDKRWRAVLIKQL
jgi:hypothetical protein